MNCPKCNFEIDEKMMVCPNCKKVLKLVCPKCKTINQGNLCKKCGFTIIVKCHQCGKINQTIDEKCKKCGFSTYSSVAISTSNTDEFACLVITFPNVSDVKSALGSTKLFDKFKANLDKLILDYTRENELAREIIDEAYVIRFNKNFSFAESAKSAVNGAIGILDAVTELNFKLDKLKNILLNCNIAILKRNINTKPDEYKSGFDIKMINQGKDRNKLLNGLQVITDSNIYEQVCDDFDLSTLSSAFVNGQTVMFFELNIKKYVKIPVKTEENEEDLQALSKLPTFSEEFPVENDLYNVDGISFDELSVCFINTESVNVIPQVLDKLQENPKNIVAIKTGKEFAPLTGNLLTKIEKLKKFANVFRVTCNDNMKYEPYGFFREFISSICNFSVAPRNFYLNNFEIFNAIDPLNYVRSLINAKKIENSNPDEVRSLLFDIFFSIFASLPNSLLYIEDFDKIDDSSYEILQVFFEKFEEFNISYVITTGKDYSLHKNAHFLLSNRFYTNITVRPTPFKDILATNIKKYNEILKSYCIEKIAHNFKGSFLYFQQAIDYLLDSDYLTLSDDGVLTVASQDNIFIPTSLDSLITKRLKVLSKDKNAYKLLGTFLLIGPRIDSSTIGLLEIKDEGVEVQKLVEKNYIYVSSDSSGEPGAYSIFINNYNLLKDNFISATNYEAMQEIVQELLEKIFTQEEPNPVKSFIFSILNMKKEEISNWEKLSLLNSSLSDFNAYLNCSDNILKLADESVDENSEDLEHSEKTKDDYQAEIFENVSTLLHKFSPDKANNITQLILNSLEKSTDDEKTVKLCNKMLQGCLIGGNYAYAFDLVHKILSKFSNLSFKPLDRNFNISFFMLSLVKIEILFSVGNLKDCVESGEEVLNALTVVNISQIKPQHLSLNQFEEIIFDAMSFVAMSKIILLMNDLQDFVAKIQANIGKVPEFFNLFLVLEKLVRSMDVKLPTDFKTGEDKFSKILINIVKAFGTDKQDYKKFADDLHQAKISAKMNKLFQIELMCDLLIGFSYFKLKQEKKASAIYHNVLETSIKNGLKMVTHLGWYLMSMLKFEQQETEVAFGIASNASIQLEKDSNAGDYLLFLFRILLAEILMAKKERESAELCLKNANFIKGKYGLNYEIVLNTEIQAAEDARAEVPKEEVISVEEIK